MGLGLIKNLITPLYACMALNSNQWCPIPTGTHDTCHFLTTFSRHFSFLTSHVEASTFLQSVKKTMKKRMKRPSMEKTTLRRRRQSLLSTIPPPLLPPSEEESRNSLLLNQSSWFIKLLAFQADFVANFFVFLTSPFVSLAHEYFRSTEEAKETVEYTVVAATRVPAQVAGGGAVLVRKIGFGCIGAFYAFIFLLAILILSVIVSIGVVRFWVEEPVFLREPVYFDYTQIHPTAVFPVEAKKKWEVPAGHTFFVSLVFLMPESYYNRDIGIFQVTAEVISTYGKTLAMSSQPCMLGYRSLPVRLMRTAMMSVPLVLGISAESQLISVTLLKHKEGYPRTGVIRATLHPRAGTNGLPQLYSADIVIKSELPFIKQLVRSWKWTFYVWMSMYVYTMLLVIGVCCCRPLFFPIGNGGREMRVGEGGVRRRDRDRDVMESLERWRTRSRSKRKAPFPPDVYGGDRAESTASSSNVFQSPRPREEASEVVDDFGGFTDSESVTQGGG